LLKENVFYEHFDFLFWLFKCALSFIHYSLRTPNPYTS